MIHIRHIARFASSENRLLSLFRWLSCAFIRLTSIFCKLFVELANAIPTLQSRTCYLTDNDDTGGDGDKDDDDEDRGVVVNQVVDEDSALGDVREAELNSNEDFQKRKRGSR